VAQACGEQEEAEKKKTRKMEKGKGVVHSFVVAVVLFRGG
jgi:hypothetical protein